MRERDYKRKAKLVFRITVGDSGSYTKTHIRIQEFYEVLLTEKIYCCTKNPEYFGKPDRFQAMAAMGHTYLYEFGHDRRDVELDYLHASNILAGNSSRYYCSHKVEINGDFRTLQWATKILLRTSRDVAKAENSYYGPKENYSWFLNDPEAVVTALRKRNIVEIEFIDVPFPNGMRGHEATRRVSPPHVFLTQGEVA